MPIYFFDTSALQHRYFDSTYSRTVRRIVSSSRSECFISDITVLEIAGALAKICRRRSQDTKDYDGVKNYDKADQEFWKDVSTAKLKVHPTTNRDVVAARNLLRFAGLFKNRDLGSADALIAVCSREFALERRRKVIFYTSDWKQYDICRKLGAFTAVLKLRFLGTPKN